jgi:hypothetical protein
MQSRRRCQQSFAAMNAEALPRDGQATLGTLRTYGQTGRKLRPGTYLFHSA